MHEGARTIDPPARGRDTGAPANGAGGGRGSGTGGRRAGGGRRILKCLAGTLSAAILATAAAGWLYYDHLNDNIRKGERSSGDSGAERSAPNSAGQTPLNVLLLGSDSRAGEDNVELGGARGESHRKPLADVQMLLHVSADRSNASLVSIPRDTRVDIPECTDPRTGEVYPPVNNIINESLARGGPGCTLATWEKLTDIYIDHWVMVDFAGVVSMADAVGGVEVCVTENIWDRELSTGEGGSGLKLKAGRRKIQGETALQWLRTRYAFGSDVHRTHAQHMYLNSMVRELRSQNVFTDTGRLMSLAEAGTKALTVDKGLGDVRKLFDLGMQLKSVPSDRITTTTMPAVEDPLAPTAHLIPKPGEADRLFAMMREDISFDDNGRGRGKESGRGSGGDRTKKPAQSPAPKPGDQGPPPADSGTIPVTVLNGTGPAGKQPVQGRAGAVVSTLVGAGFTQAVLGDLLQGQERTTIGYPRSAGAQGKANALSLAERIGLPADQVKASSDLSVITLVVGADWPQGSRYTAGPDRTPEEGDVPDSANPLNGSDKSACMDVYDPFVW